MSELFASNVETKDGFQVFISTPIEKLIKDNVNLYSFLGFAKNIEIVDEKYNKKVKNVKEKLISYKFNLIFGRSVTQRLFGNKNRLKLEFQIFKHDYKDIYYIFLPSIDEIINRKVSVFPIQVIQFLKKFLRLYKEKQFLLYPNIKLITKHDFSLLSLTTKENLIQLNNLTIKDNMQEDFLQELTELAPKEKVISLDIETPSLIVGNGLISISLYLPSIHTAYVIATNFDKYKEFFRNLFFKWDTVIVQHNLKFDLKYLFHFYKFELSSLTNEEFNVVWNKKQPKFFDTYLLPAFLNVGNHSLSLKGWAGYFYNAPSWHLFDSGEIVSNFSEIPLKEVIKYNAYDTYYSYMIYKKWQHLLHHFRYTSLVYPIFLLTLFTEVHGVNFDTQLLENTYKKYEEELVKLKKRIYFESNKTISNPLGVLDIRNWVKENKIENYFEKTEKGNLSFSKSSIEKVYHSSKLPKKYKEILRLILLYRTLDHQKATYFDPNKYYSLISQDGRVHTTFKLNATYSGRLSSESPNIQQIGQRISITDYMTKDEDYLKDLFVSKKLYRSRDGYKIVEIDLSQAEVRWLAIVSQDPQLLKVYIDNVDIYRRYGSYSTGKKPEEITKAERQVFKAVVLGIQYGIGASSLARMLKMSQRRAKKLLDDYFELFKYVKKFRQKLLGVKPNKYGFYYIPSITRNKIELRCISNRELSMSNYPIQSLSSDFNLMIFYYFMKYLRKNYPELVKDIEIVNFVHDAGYFEVKEEVVDKFTKILENFYKNLYVNMDDFIDFLFRGLQKFYRYIYKEKKYVFLLVPMKGEIEISEHF